MREFLDTISLEEDPFLEETPEEVTLYHLDGTPDEAGQNN